MKIKYDYDVIVVGGGHSGVEAALAAARMGAKTAMFIIKYESIGRMSCNPSIGGPAKGHLAREIDALGGEMARVTDLSGIQFRMLNKKKGPAVWAPRSQNDRLQYSIEMRIAVEKQAGLDIIESEIVEILTDNQENRATTKDSISQIKSIGVKSNIGQDYYAPKVIITCGTFLRGTIHIGDKSFSGGRSGEPASDYLSSSLEAIGLRLGRFKTGTPPRIDMNTINYNLVEEQPGDEPPQGFSHYLNIPLKNIVSCYLTYTNAQTHKIIRDNISRSALYGGKISGIGPRYCPSIEDKIVRFADKDKHHLFIEPEGINTIEGYVNGISTSLPPDVQKAILKSIPALEKASIIRYGYAIEYDYVLPGQIFTTLETRAVKGLYLAGQINGTSGYEEAAAQGMIVGINAVLALDGKEPLILTRSSSYIGVLIDDLIAKGTNEPYRMFTSRSEYRLSLRQDNADERLMPIGYKLGLVSEFRWQKFQEVQRIIEKEIDYLSKNNSKIRLAVNEDIKEDTVSEEPTRLVNILRRPNTTLDDMISYGYDKPEYVSAEIWDRIAIRIKYEGYLKRQEADIRKFEKFENLELPHNLDYLLIKTITMEAREKLNRIKPRSVGQASRISGVNYTDITALLVYLKRTGIINP